MIAVRLKATVTRVAYLGFQSSIALAGSDVLEQVQEFGKAYPPVVVQIELVKKLSNDLWERDGIEM